MEGIIIDIQNDSYAHLCNVHYHIILSGSNCISAIFLNKAISASFTVMGPLIWYINAHVCMQEGFDGRGQQTASPKLTAIMSGGVGISGRELYKYR